MKNKRYINFRIVINHFIIQYASYHNSGRYSRTISVIVGLIVLDSCNAFKNQIVLYYAVSFATYILVRVFHFVNNLKRTKYSQEMLKIFYIFAVVLFVFGRCQAIPLVGIF